MTKLISGTVIFYINSFFIRQSKTIKHTHTMLNQKKKFLTLLNRADDKRNACHPKYRSFNSFATLPNERVNQINAFAAHPYLRKKRIFALDDPACGRLNQTLIFVSMPREHGNQNLTLAPMLREQMQKGSPICFDVTRPCEANVNFYLNAMLDIRAMVNFCFNASQGMAAKRGFRLFSTPQIFCLLFINQ